MIHSTLVLPLAMVIFILFYVLLFFNTVINYKDIGEEKTSLY